MAFRILLLLILMGCARTQVAVPPPESASPTARSETPETVEEPEEAPPASAGDWSYRSLGQAMRTKSENAVVQEASKILDKNPKDLKALNALAVMYIVNKKLDMAKLVLARAIKNHPNDPSLACNLGIVNLLEERIPEAIAEFQRALSLDKGHIEAGYHLGVLHTRFKNAEAALPLLARAYSRLPKALVGSHYAEALRMARKSRQAAGVYQDMKAESSRDVALVFGYASLLVEDVKDKARGLRMVDRIRLLTEDAAILKKADDLASKGQALR